MTKRPGDHDRARLAFSRALDEEVGRRGLLSLLAHLRGCHPCRHWIGRAAAALRTLAALAVSNR